jgi:crotonobetainyl-CoA:carnitine CoA-transferase CaiB-like acyl-CoA transferase
MIGQPEWLDDPRFATREGWRIHLEEVIRPAIEGWAADKTKLDAARELNEAGIAAGPVNSAPDVIDDPHVAARDMLVEVPRTDGEPPYLMPGNPVKMTKVAEGPETRVPWVGEHTDEILSQELGLAAADLTRLRDAGVIG